MTRRLNLVLTVGLWLAAAVFCAKHISSALTAPGHGLDFQPLWNSGHALATWSSVYTDPFFVYPPTQAVLDLPLSLLSYANAEQVWIPFVACCSIGAITLALSARGGRWWPMAAAFGAILLLKSDLMLDSLWLGNLSLVLAPIAVGIALLYERNRWTAGSALLVLSLLIKPLFAPLMLIALLTGHWRAFLRTAIPGGIVLAICVAVIPGGWHFFDLLGFLGKGHNLAGSLSSNNLSLVGVGENFGLHVLPTIGRVVVLAVAAAGGFVWWQRDREPGAVAAFAALLLTTVFLAGSLSEIHFLVSVVGLLILAATLRNRSSDVLLLAPGLLVYLFPRYDFHDLGDFPNPLQLRYVAAQALLWLAALWMCAGPARSHRVSLAGEPETVADAGDAGDAVTVDAAV